MHLKLWDQKREWEEAEIQWDQQAREASKTTILKNLNVLPNMAGITPETAKFLKWKSLKWMIQKDHDWGILRSIFKRPFFYLKNYLRSLFKKKSFFRKGDFFYYGIQNEKEFETLLKKPNTLFLLGFSYCHKPFECPSGRFTDQCLHDLNNSVCQQCFIGKSTHATPHQMTEVVYIPTVHYIGNKVFELIEKWPDKELIFLITACEMTLTMFADWGNLAQIKGVGVRLDGRICNTMKAFELSEKGIKPGLTVVLDQTKATVLEWIKLRRLSSSSSL